MKCSEFRDRISEYLDNSLEGNDLQAFQAHLQICQECGLELEAVQNLDTRLKQEVPALWESIEPSPVFLNRLKNLELEREKPSFWNIFDPIITLFQDHRPAMAAGLTVLIAIVLAITVIPSVIDSEDSDNDMVAMAPESGPASDENTTEPASRVSAAPKFLDQDSIEMMGAEGLGTSEPMETYNGDIMFSWQEEPEQTPAPTTTNTPAIVPMPTPSPSQVPEADYGVMGSVTGSTTLNISAITTESTEHKIEKSDVIQAVINDYALLDLLEDWSVYYADVVSDPELEGYTCSGSTVGIAIEKAEPIEPVIYVCVNPASQTVLHFMLVD